MPQQYLLAIDQGTTSSRAIVFDVQGKIISTSQQELEQHFPDDGWVEHHPDTIWNDTVNVCRDALFRGHVTPSEVAGIGITNQRETTVVWDRNTGEVIYNAIVWQDRRTAEYCTVLRSQDLEMTVQEKTGLLIDPYFSATKLYWILQNVDGAREKAERGELAFGTIDCFLLWRLTGGAVHATDATNASRTMLFNIHTQDWDDELLTLFDVPRLMLPTVKDSSADFGVTTKDLFGVHIPIGGIAGDQQAAAVGQACFHPGMMKSTYGTGAFLLLNTGEHAVQSQNRLLTTVAYRLNGKTTYALEGSIFIAGAAVQWLRDEMHLFNQAQESEILAQSVDATEGVYFIPAFTGLGAPYWNPTVRGAIFGLTRDTNVAHITRAALEAICYQTRDVLECMLADGAKQCEALRVDGGMVANNWLCDYLANTLQTKVERPQVIETTARGAAFLAGLQVGVYDSLQAVESSWQQEKVFVPSGIKTHCDQAYQCWQEMIKRLL